MLDLYSAGTTNGQRATIVIEETGLPFTLHRVDTGKGEARTPEFRKINPLGRIPALVDSEGIDGKPVTLSQSWAIAVYLAEKSGKLMPKDAEGRAKVMQWLFFIASDVQSTRPNQALFKITGDATQPVTAWFAQRQLEVFQDVDKRLGEAEYLAGDLSVADFAIWTLFDRGRAMVKEHNLANVARWGAALDARPALQRALASLK